MTRPLDFLRRLRLKPASRTAAAAPAPVESAFDLRLKKMGGVRAVTVSRAVLFRTRSLPQEA